MTGLTFRLKGEPEERIDCSPLTPDTLAGLSANEIERLPVGTTKRRLTVGDVFDLSGSDASDIRFEGASARLDRIGEAMSAGAIHVADHAGFRLGRAMTGGRIRVDGSVGDLAGSAMSGGEIAIAGDAGARLGGGDAGEMKGMSGGRITVEGSAGPRCADRMRRGTILVSGDCGDDAASRMIAGTLIVGGRSAGAPGRLMKRGTLILAGGAERFTPTFIDCGIQELMFLTVMARALSAEGLSLPFDGRPMRKIGGDTAILGLGEIFIPA